MERMRFRTMSKRPLRAGAAGLAMLGMLSVAHAATKPAATDTPVWRATHGVLLSVTRAGNRLVATGDRGIVLLSDDQGANWTQAATQTGALLTAALFTSPTEGWAVGQDSTILHTADAGAHWTTQLSASGADQALFSVASLPPDQPGETHLIATGAYALALETQNGKDWSPVKLPKMDEDYHLNCVLAHGADVVVIGEAGHAFMRHDGAWTAMPLPYDGSQFGCLASRDGAFYSFGLRGSLFVSTTAAPGWKRIDTGEQRPIFGGTVLRNGSFVLVGGNGLLMLFDPATAKIRKLPPPTGATLSGVVEAANGTWVLVGDDGIHVVDPKADAAGGEVVQ
jgi:photosystem II stability/assembly factor-like uncharacterized protein